MSLRGKSISYYGDDLESERLSVARVGTSGKSPGVPRQKESGIFSHMVGSSPKMQECFAMLEKIMPTDGRVLIHGESGTGKELIARCLHFGGPRRDRPYVVVDCGTLPDNLVESELFGHVQGAFTGASREKKGLFEEASSGTLFLDEIASLPLEMQSKLLRVVQEGEIRPVGSTKTKSIDVRIIAADSCSLRQEVVSGRFRQDLFYRLSVISVNVPPLRERREDIPGLAAHFLKGMIGRHNKEAQGFALDTLTFLENYDWPGNVRELQNAVERTVILADKALKVIPPDLLPPEILSPTLDPTIPEPIGVPSTNLRSQKERYDKQRVVNSLIKNRWNQSAAARELGITEGAIRYKMRKFDIARTH